MKKKFISPTIIPLRDIGIEAPVTMSAIPLEKSVK